MAVKSFKKTSKKSIVAGSPAIEEHEQIMSSVRAESAEPAPSGSPAAPTPAASASGTTIGVFSTLNTEPLKNVQTRVPLSIYEKLNRMKTLPDSAPLSATLWHRPFRSIANGIPSDWGGV